MGGYLLTAEVFDEKSKLTLVRLVPPSSLKTKKHFQGIIMSTGCKIKTYNPQIALE
jgi:hypothetical protein